MRLTNVSATTEFTVVKDSNGSEKSYEALSTNADSEIMIERDSPVKKRH